MKRYILKKRRKIGEEDYRELIWPQGTKTKSVRLCLKKLSALMVGVAMVGYMKRLIFVSGVHTLHGIGCSEYQPDLDS